MGWIYRYESKGIQRWILESNQLRDLAAGSHLVEQLVATAKAEIEKLEGEVINAAAGGATARFRTRDALETFASEWPMHVAHLAPGLHVVQAWTEESSSTADVPTDRVRDLLAVRRNVAPEPPLEAGPLIKRTGRTGLPAVDVPPDLSRRRPWQNTWDAAAVAKERCRLEARSSQSENAVLAGFEFEENIERWPKAPVAVVHADASGVGQRLNELRLSLSQLGEFSRALSEATREATREALGQLPLIRGCRIARPVVVGGDDLTFIIAAAHGLDFTEHWLSAFSRATESRKKYLGGEKLHAGAGVVYVHRAYPFATAYEHAERECRRAKQSVLESSSGRPGDTVLRFRRITTSRADERTAVLWGSWRLGKVPALRELVLAAAQLPRGALRTWLTLLDRGDAKRDALWRRTREVADPKMWRRFEVALSAVDTDPASGLSRVQPSAARTARATPVRDALALLHIERGR